MGMEREDIVIRYTKTNDDDDDTPHLFLTTLARPDTRGPACFLGVEKDTYISGFLHFLSSRTIVVEVYCVFVTFLHSDLNSTSYHHCFASIITSHASAALISGFTAPCIH